MPNSTPKLLEMNNIGKRFPGVIALDGVNFHINCGEIVGLLGENGAGKSTLMKILGGIYQPDDGEIFFGDKSTKISSVNDSIAKGIAFIHQELNMLDNLDVASNVYLGREPLQRGIGKYLHLIDRKKLNADTAIYLKRLGLEVSPETPLNRLSIGQQQLVEIAKALSLNAKILIMDEPTSSLTTTETEKLLSVVRELKSNGVSVIYITHRLGEVSEICDRAVVLRDGKNAGELKRGELTHENIVQLMVGRALKHSYQPRKNDSDETIFETKDLVTSRYPNKKVSFSVKKGEIFGIAGLVGAGRSELVQTIFGVDSKNAGEVLIENRNLRGKSAREAIDKGVYLIPEDRRNTGLLTEFGIRENITLPALKRYLSNGLVNKSKEKVVSNELCEKLNIKTASIETLVKNLSGGNQQKVVLAKWLQLDPKLLIFDEPTRGIDVGAKAEIYNLMRGLAKTGVAIIVISSDMEEILGLSDRLAVMREGQITGILEREDCSEKNVMKLAVGGV
jgi:ribose transport system ATP-binding protein